MANEGAPTNAIEAGNRDEAGLETSAIGSDRHSDPGRGRRQDQSTLAPLIAALGEIEGR
jgi:hypothetical protein